MEYKGDCNTCKWYFYDDSVGSADCENTDIDEDAIVKHFEDCKPGCPYYKLDERYTEDALKQEEDYINSLVLKTETSPYDAKIKINAEKVRLLCIKMDWYTCGDCADYERMLAYCNDCSDDDYIIDCLYTIAKDIYKHSNIKESPKECISDIVYSLYTECTSLFLN